MLRSIEGEVAWVTGAGTGIGQAGAIALAAHGAKVVLTGRRVEPLERTAAIIREAGGEALIAPGDFTDRVAIAGIVKQMMDAYGRCDILVNSAGINIPKRSWAAVDADGFDSVVAAD